jgi:hypothetical protein
MREHFRLSGLALAKPLARLFQLLCQNHGKPPHCEIGASAQYRKLP